MKKVIAVVIALLMLAGYTNAQSKFGLSVQGAASLPMGDFGDACKTGFGGLATVAYSATKNLDVVVTSGYLTYDLKESTVMGANVTGSTSFIPAVAGVRYFFTTANFKPYVTAQLGMFFISAKADASIMGFSMSTTSNESKFGFDGGLGFLYKLGNKLDLDVTATYNSISTDGSASSFINILAGVRFQF